MSCIIIKNTRVIHENYKMLSYQPLFIYIETTQNRIQIIVAS